MPFAAVMLEGLLERLRAWDLGVQDSGLRVQGLGFGVQVVGFRGSGLGFRGFRVIRLKV